METTIQIDREILKALTEKARKAGMPVSEFTNALLRREVSREIPPQSTERYRCPTFSLGTPNILGANLDRALHLSAVLEDERVIGQR
jgi:hypothetical protein